MKTENERGKPMNQSTIIATTVGFTGWLKRISNFEFPISCRFSRLNTEHCNLNTVLLLALLLGALAPRAEGAQATGGTVTTNNIGGTNYIVHTFTTVGTNVNAFQVSVGGDVEYLIVGGGGGGGAFRGGGGGAGGYRSNVGGTPLTISGPSNYTIVVGNGGTGGAFRTTISYDAGAKGGDSSFAGIVATGGGGGAPGLASHPSFLDIPAGVAGGDGGSGGGGSGYSAVGKSVGAGGTGNSPISSPAQGNNGGAGPASGSSSGSGGGAGAAGSNTNYASGGNGLANAISGTSVYYAGGGGSGTYAHPGGTSGGLGGGGAGGNAADPSPYSMPTNGTPNTGGGGGGGGNPSVAAVTPGAAGGSGIVIVRYLFSNINVGSTSNAFPNTFVNATSTWSYTISGVALTNNLTVSVPSSSVFTISSNNVNFGSEVVLATNDVGNVPPTNIWVRFIPTAATNYSEVITNASPGFPTMTVQVTGLGLASTTPLLAVTPASLDFGNVITNKTPANQMFTVTGVNLTNSITVTAPPACFWLSTNGSDFSQSPVTLATNGSGGIDITNIYVRFTPTAGQTYAGSITNSTAGAFEVKTVSVTGNGVVQTLVVSTNALASFGTVRTNTTSANLSYNVAGSYLETDVTVTAPSAEFEVSTNSATGFGPSCTVTVANASSPSGGNLSATPVYVRFTPPAAQAYSGSITNASTGVALQTVGVSGNGYAGKVWTGASSTDWGTAGNWSGGVPGTTDDVLIDGAPNGRHPTLDLSSSAVTIKSLTLGSSSASTLTFQNGNVTDRKLIVSSNVTIGASGTLTHLANGASETHRLFVEVAGDLTIAAGGKIDVTAKGYGAGQGPAGAISCHGGLGVSASGGATYGSLHAPTNCGAGYANAGGGAVKLTVTGRTLLNGDITAYGGNSLDSGNQSGAGGSIFLTTGSLEGTGNIRADNLSGAYWHGGGGRVAVVLTAPGSSFTNHTGLITAYGGAGVNGHSAAGTVYLRGYGVAENDGILIIDNSTVPLYGNATTLLSANTVNKTVGEVRLLNNGLLQLAAGETLQVSGVWSNTATAGYGFQADAGSTVEFVNGGVPGRVYGNTTWQNLTIASAGKVVSFQAGKTNTVAGTPTFDNRVTLLSTQSGAQWHLRKAGGPGTQPVGRVSVQDSHAGTAGVHLTFLASGGTDLGNNINWGKWPPTGTMILLR
jgi:hypothetical protein